MNLLWGLYRCAALGRSDQQLEQPLSVVAKCHDGLRILIRIVDAALNIDGFWVDANDVSNSYLKLLLILHSSLPLIPVQQGG